MPADMRLSIRIDADGHRFRREIRGADQELDKLAGATRGTERATDRYNRTTRRASRETQGFARHLELARGADHPRASGDHNTILSIGLASVGSSPREWGPQGRRPYEQHCAATIRMRKPPPLALLGRATPSLPRQEAARPRAALVIATGLAMLSRLLMDGHRCQAVTLPITK